MDIINPQVPSYTFLEKYFKVLPEGRIRRYQFFVRYLIPGILFATLSMFLIPMVLKSTMGFMGIFLGSYISSMVYSVIFFLIGYTLIRKRCHDFGGSGMIAIPIFIVNIVASFISGVVGILTVGLHMQNQLLDIFFAASAYINQPISILMLVTMLILLFRPGKKEENQYGKAEYAKVSFLG